LSDEPSAYIRANAAAKSAEKPKIATDATSKRPAELGLLVLLAVAAAVPEAPERVALPETRAEPPETQVEAPLRTPLPL